MLHKNFQWYKIFLGKKKFYVRKKFLREGKKFFRVYKDPLLCEKIPVPKKGRQKYLDFDIQEELWAANLRSASGK